MDYIPTGCGGPTPTRLRQPQRSYGYGNRYADSYCGTASNSNTAAAPDTAASPVGRSGSKKILAISL